MMNKQKNSLYALLGALCMAAFMGIQLLVVFISSVEYNASLNVLPVITWIIMIAYAVVLFMQQKNVGLIAVSGAYAGILLLNLLMNADIVGRYEVLLFLAAAAMLTLVVLNCVPSLQRAAVYTKFLWVIPAILTAVNELIALIDVLPIFEYLEYMDGLYIFVILIGIVQQFVFVAYYLFHGLWLGTTCDPAKQKQQTWEYRPYPQQPYPQQNAYQPYPQQNAYQPYPQQNAYQPHPQQNAYQPYPQQTPPAADPYQSYAPQKAAESAAEPQTASAGAEELKIYKELLDIGVITQQEYDAKKKQLLGL